MEGYLEHELAAKTLQRLGTIANAASSEHLAAGKVLKELVEHHIGEEENNVWSDAKKHFSDEDRVAMNKRYLAAKTRVKIAPSETFGAVFWPMHKNRQRAATGIPGLDEVLHGGLIAERL